MLPYLSDIARGGTDYGRESSLTATLPLLEDFSMVLGSHKDKRKKAEADGFYTVGTVHFKIRKGKPIPLNADEVFYDEREPVVTAGDHFAKKLAAKTAPEETATDAEDETADDPDGETAEQPKLAARIRAKKTE